MKLIVIRTDTSYVISLWLSRIRREPHTYVALCCQVSHLKCSIHVMEINLRYIQYFKVLRNYSASPFPQQSRRILLIW